MREGCAGGLGLASGAHTRFVLPRHNAGCVCSRRGSLRTLYDYIHNQRYDEAIRIVYGRLKRDLVRRHSLHAFDVPQLIATVSRTRQPPDLAILNADFQALEEATRQPRRIDRDKFLDLFFKITRIRENIG